ncbi:MAG: alpha/beta hydrolase [Beijerinckiaceae bacterium]|nr:alpha/beta hydrolase [Beijerinckiaceae bacterium]
MTRRIFRALALAGMLAAGSAAAQNAAPVNVNSGVSYEFIGRWDVARLNRILNEDMPKFSGVTVAYTQARNAVNLYRVTYSSVVPERGNKPIIATGLLALPDTPDPRMHLVSYQHGTVYGKDEVPSNPEKSPETQVMIAQFAGQGYALVGADYFGMGASDEPEGYMVKGSHQQATYDMLVAGRDAMASMKRGYGLAFLAGWSQGGFVTMALLEKLEKASLHVAAAATASAPVDLFAGLSGFLSFPRKIDAVWTNSLFVLSAFAYENYYGVPGLARSLFAPEHYETARKAYMREPMNPADLPTDLRKLLQPAYFNPDYFAASAYGRLVADAQVYRWVIATPTRNYYGEADEAISIGLGRLAANYQQAIGGGNPKVEAISTGPTTHRGTFAKAIPEWKAWFDGMR